VDGSDRPRRDVDSIAIVHDQSFVGHAIASMLEDQGLEVLANFTDSAQVSTLDDDDDPALFIVGAFISEDALRHERELIHRRFPEAKIILIDAGFSHAALDAAISQNLDAYLSLELEPDLILNGIRLVLAGNECFPAGPIEAASNTDENVGSELQEQLSPRECEVLRHASNGLANKLIAWKLNITEATVKAHINSVLRKIGASNRTQAARWALDHGLVDAHTEELWSPTATTQIKSSI